MNRLGEIEVRMKEIGTEVDEATGDTLTALDDELRMLTDERQGIMGEIEQRAKMKAAVLAGAGTVVKEMGLPKTSTYIEPRTYTAADDEYRDAWAKSLLCQPMTEIEQRALADVNNMEFRAVQDAITTTDTTYVAPGTNTVGINNGGLFIPQYVSDRLLEELYIGSPILEDVGKMSVPGLIKFPYEEYADPAKWVEEGICNDLESIEWKELATTIQELSKTIRISWKLEAMTPTSFVDYIVRELRVKMQKERARGVIYGNGGLEPFGIKASSYVEQYSETDNLIDLAVNVSERIPPEYIVGAKFYISRKSFNSISLTKNDNGDYILPPINGNRPESISQFPIAVDPYLKDGDAIIGNLDRGVVLNTVEPMSITKDVSGRCRINDYTAYEVLSVAVFPGHTIFLELNSTPTP